jgi:hypothetical protein
MSIIEQLSSQVGQRVQESNMQVVTKCLANPTLLYEIARALESKDAALLGDCAEVFTKVAEEKPLLVVPYAQQLTGLITHKPTRVRWEAVHALALTAQHIPHIIKPLLGQIMEMIKTDKSIIVRDYSIDIIAGYALAGEKEAEEACPLLKESLLAWDGRHALARLIDVGRMLPAMARELGQIAEQYLEDKSGVVRKTAKSLLKMGK